MSIELALGAMIASLIIGTLGLLIGALALIFVIGIKNSTHQVVWKDLSENQMEDPYAMAAEEDPDWEPYAENPNKRLKRSEEDEDLVDLDDPSETSGF